MCRPQCLLAFFAILFTAVNSWDIAITMGDQIEFYKNGDKTAEEGVKSTGLTALAYDAVYNMLLFVDSRSDNTSIFRYYLNTKKSQRLVGKKSDENIQGLTYDPVSGKLFWTDANTKSIYWKYSESKNDVYGNSFNFSMNQNPRAIAVDSCRGYIYWTNINISHPTIERARIDGTDRKVIVNSDIFMPISVVVDQQMKKIFWADDREGIHYSIESSDLDGQSRRTIVKGTLHRPNALAVSKDSLYWIDWGYSTVWKVPKNPTAEASDVKPEELFSFTGTPFGIVANYSIEDQTAGIGECAPLKNLSLNKTAINYAEVIPTDTGVLCLHGIKVEGKSECTCSPGYTGKRCEIPVCQNYCLQGECVPVNGQPKCRCENGFSGSRCEINLCSDRCLNNGQCVIKDQKPSCQCSEDYTGARCESLKSVILESADMLDSTSGGWDSLRDPIIMVLGVVSGTLSVFCALLIAKVIKLKKRPRIKKRIIVQKNSTPLTARPDQCEITIENCCNMNICETPCFEPRSTIRPNLLDAKPGKEEKKNLISNMELPDDF
ncbi:hypothetical protein O0L34_g16734 [Tuta absoluta]|nr:hypothetical protein O0L34_g16734 [Tuta absoluta]